MTTERACEPVPSESWTMTMRISPVSGSTQPSVPKRAAVSEGAGEVTTACPPAC